MPRRRAPNSLAEASAHRAGLDTDGPRERFGFRPGEVPALCGRDLLCSIMLCRSDGEHPVGVHYAHRIGDRASLNEDFLRLVPSPRVFYLSLIHISEPTRLLSISYAVFC